MTPMPALIIPTSMIETPFGNAKRPLRTDSLETFNFLGFTHKEAEKRLGIERILMNDPDRKVSMLTTIVAQLPDRIGYSFQEYFDSYGISRELQDAIMDHEFADIRDTASPGCWIRDAIRGRMQILESFFTKAHSQSALDLEAPTTEEDLVASETMDCLTMYKGIGAWRTAGLMNISKPSGLSLNHLLRGEPLRADFSWNNPGEGPRGLYFTTQKELALKFAHYATRYTHGIGSSCIIKMCVPHEFIEDEKHIHITAEDVNHAWRKVFTHCRLDRLLYIYKRKPRPERLAAMIELQTIISGHVSTGHNEAPLKEVQNPKLLNALNERDVLHVEMEDGREERAEQWMFRNCILNDLEDAVGNQGAGAFSIESVCEMAWQSASVYPRRPELEYHGSIEDTHISPVGIVDSHTGVDGADDSSDGIDLEIPAVKQQSSGPTPTEDHRPAEAVTTEQSSSEPSPTNTSKRLTVEQQSPGPSHATAFVLVEHASAEQQSLEPFRTDPAIAVEQQFTKQSRNDSSVPVEYLTGTYLTDTPVHVECATVTPTTDAQTANSTTTTTVVNGTPGSSELNLAVRSVEHG